MHPRPWLHAIYAYTSKPWNKLQKPRPIEGGRRNRVPAMLGPGRTYTNGGTVIFEIRREKRLSENARKF